MNLARTILAEQPALSIRALALEIAYRQGDPTLWKIHMSAAHAAKLAQPANAKATRLTCPGCGKHTDIADLPDGMADLARTIWAKQHATCMRRRSAR